MDEELLADEESGGKKIKKPKTTAKRETYPVWLTNMLKEYDKVLEMKLPNEFRGAITGYNHRSTSDYLIDDNKYGFF